MSGRALQIGIVGSALGDDLRLVPLKSRRLGFSGLLLDAPWPNESLWGLSASGRRDLKHALAVQDQHLIGLHIDTAGAGLADEAMVDRVLARLDRAMETAAGLGCRLLCADIGPLPPAPPVLAPRPQIAPHHTGSLILPQAAPSPPAPPPELSPADRAAWSRVDAAMRELGDRADRYGVTVAIRSELAAQAAVERALDGADCPWFGIDLDPLSLLRDGWDLDEALSRLGPLVRHVRVRDARLGHAYHVQLTAVGEGEVPWPALLAGLDAGGYHGWYTVDPAGLPDRVSAAVAALKQLRAMQ